MGPVAVSQQCQPESPYTFIMSHLPIWPPSVHKGPEGGPGHERAGPGPLPPGQTELSAVPVTPAPAWLPRRSPLWTVSTGRLHLACSPARLPEPSRYPKSATHSRPAQGLSPRVTLSPRVSSGGPNGTSPPPLPPLPAATNNPPSTSTSRPHRRRAAGRPSTDTRHVW